MKLKESSVEYLPQEEGLQGIYKQIERCARTCYKSEDKITEDSAKGFVDRMIKSHHTAMLEHGTVYLSFINTTEGDSFYFGKYDDNKYSITNYDNFGFVYVTTNLRVLVENDWLDDLKYSSSPTEFHEIRHSFKFICSRAIANELVRHRKFSFAQESQRYCNYSKDKHGNGITFIIPSWIDRNREPNTEAEVAWLDAMKKAESAYIDMVSGITRKGIVVMPADEKLTPQQARDVLPNATKTELIMTGFASDWRYLLDLRLFGKTGQPHPDMIDLMEKLRYEALEAGIWEDIMKYPSKFNQ